MRLWRAARRVVPRWVSLVAAGLMVFAWPALGAGPPIDPTHKPAAGLLKFELLVRMPRGGEQTFLIIARDRPNAEAMAATQTGGKVLGGRQVR